MPPRSQGPLFHAWIPNPHQQRWEDETVCCLAGTFVGTHQACAAQLAHVQHVVLQLLMCQTEELRVGAQTPKETR